MDERSCSLGSVKKAVREYEGVTRKHAIGEMIKALRLDSPDVIASFGEDAAVIRHGDEEYRLRITKANKLLLTK